MREFPEVALLILKHLPPTSGGVPNVRALDERSRAWCAALAQKGDITLDSQRAVDATVAGDVARAEEAAALLRPHGRAIFIVPASLRWTLQRSAEVLTAAGLVRILIEVVSDGEFLFARGERPAEQASPADPAGSNAQAEASQFDVLEPDEAARLYRHLYLLVRQQPPSRGWDDLPPDATWHALTLHDQASRRAVLLAFTSLAKAVAFMQPAVVAGVIRAVNKLPRFESKQLLVWKQPVSVNPTFERLWEDPRLDFVSPPLSIDLAVALKSNE
jgi:hypothetical protein